ncbi:MAG: SH3 domain-containing protein [Anaerolineae bacterium]|nr:SH3 domain-containing protein [Anaerolineae bacterium]
MIDAVLVPGFNVRNPGPYNLNFRAGPSLESTIIGSFQAGERAFAEGRNEAGDWVQITRDGASGWVFAPLAELSGAIDELPVIRNIVEIAVADGRFTTLVAAVEAAGLAGAEQRGPADGLRAHRRRLRRAA